MPLKAATSIVRASSEGKDLWGHETLVAWIRDTWKTRNTGIKWLNYGPMLIILNILSQNDGVSLRLFQAKCTLHKLNGKLAKVQVCTMYIVYVHVPVYCYKGQDVPPRHKTEVLYHFNPTILLYSTLAPHFIFCSEQFRNPKVIVNCS
jgi:hypothetical protein